MNQIIDEHGKEGAIKAGVPCIESRMLAKVLADGREFYSYEDLSAVAQVDVRGRGRGYLLTARNIVLRENQIVFRPIRNAGLKRLTHREVSMLDDRFNHVRRTHKKTISELDTVDIAAVPDQQRIQLVAKLALANLTVHTHQPKQMQRIESAAQSSGALDLMKTIEAFKE